MQRPRAQAASPNPSASYTLCQYLVFFYPLSSFLEIGNKEILIETEQGNLHLGSVSNTPPTIQFSTKSTLPSSFFASPCHQSRKEKLDKGICPFQCLTCCCIQKQRIYPAFSFLQPKQRLSQTGKRSMT